LNNSRSGIAQLGRIPPHKHQLGTTKFPIGIADVTGVGGSALLVGGSIPSEWLETSPVYSAFKS